MSLYSVVSDSDDPQGFFATDLPIILNSIALSFACLSLLNSALMRQQSGKFRALRQQRRWRCRNLAVLAVDSLFLLGKGGAIFYALVFADNALNRYRWPADTLACLCFLAIYLNKSFAIGIKQFEFSREIFTALCITLLTLYFKLIVVLKALSNSQRSTIIYITISDSIVHFLYILYFLFCPEDKEKQSGKEARDEKPISPFYSQCLLSRLSFFWIFKDYILRTRYDGNNLYSLDAREKTEYYVSKYRQFLRDPSDQSKVRRISLAMFYGQWKSYLLMVTYCSLFFINSYFAFKILVGIQYYNEMNDKYNYYTYCLFYMILFISIGITNCNNNLKAQKISNKAYSLVIYEIYEKILYMGRTRQSKSSDSIYSKVANLISSDLQIFTQNFNAALLFCISLTFQFAGSLAYAFQILSKDLLYGFAAFLLLIIPSMLMFKLYIKNITKTSKIRDTRLKQLSEMISGIRTIKLLMWTDYVSDKIAAIRNTELKRLRSAFRYLIGQRFFFEISIISIIYVPLFVYYLKNKNQATNIVVVNYVLSILGVSSSLIILFISLIGFSLSLESRVVEFLNSKFDDNDDEMSDQADETAKKQDKTHQASGKRGEIRFTANEYRWPEKLNENKNQMSSDNEFILKIPELIIDNALLIGIVGRVGCGKTALFESIIGKMTPANVGNSIEVKGNLSICPQECWIFSDSLIENIKLGELIDTIKYKTILQKVCLKEDLELFPEGGSYRLTENGANISGGQRQRVNIARCLYRNADIYLLDDPLSALDDQVAQRVFTSCIRGPNAYLQSKTILMTVSSEKFAAQCDKLLFIDGGEIVEFDEAPEILKKYKSQLFNDGPRETPTIRRDLLVAGKNMQVPSGHSLSFSSTVDTSVLVSGIEETPEVEDNNTSVLLPLKFFGRFAKRYLSALFIFLLLGVSARVLLFYINAEMFKTDALIVWSLKGEWSLLLSLIIRLLVLLFPLILSSLFQIAMIHLTRKWHSILLNRVISWPLIEFEERTAGEITNNFSSDLTTIELSLTRSLSDLSNSLIIFPGLVIYFSLKIPVLLVLAVLILLINFLFIYYYIAFITKIRQLELKGVGPIFNNIRETVSGNKLVTIFGIEGFFRNKLTKNLDDLLLIKDIIANTIPIVRIPIYISGIILNISVMVYFGQRNSLESNVVYFLNVINLFTQNVSYGIMSFADYCSRYTAVNRLDKLESIKTEEELTGRSEELRKNSRNSSEIKSKLQEEITGGPANEQGIVFERLTFSYDGTSKILQDFDLRVRKGEKIIVAGRTGAGKSTLLSCLFRLRDECIESGRILLNGKDLREIHFDELRTRIGVVTQDPFIFDDTVRFNIDPSGQKSDDEILQMLKRVNMYDFVMKSEKKLQMSINRSSLSIGQCQLLCLARILLKNYEVIILDEATSALDEITANLIGNIDIGSEVTVISIAHRAEPFLNKFDRSIYLKDGKLHSDTKLH